MREIKFRFWDKHNDKFQFIKSNHDVNYWFVGADEFPEKDLGKAGLQQYTGLKDKDGQDIYEGDIVQYQPIVCNLNTKVGEVKFSLGAFRIGDGFLSTVCNPPDFFRPQVVGNIHENPELLEAPCQAE